MPIALDHGSAAKTWATAPPHPSPEARVPDLLRKPLEEVLIERP